MRTRLILALLGIVLVATVWTFHKRLFQDDRERIQQIIEQMRVLVERKQASEFMKYFSSDYEDSSGHNKVVLAHLIKNSMNMVDELEAEVKHVDVVVSGDSAWATVTVVTRATRDGRIVSPFGSEKDPQRPRITFNRTTTGDWRIVRVENVDRE